MRKDIYKVVAVVTGVFMLTVSIMLTVNYFQVRNTTPLQTEVMETLKSLNETNSGNVQLQEQIRQLDLLARKAYFVQKEHQKAGVWLLVFMSVVFVGCLRLYYNDVIHVAPKEIDSLDEWMMQTVSRKYVRWLTGALMAVAVVVIALSNPQWFEKKAVPEEMIAEVVETPVLQASPSETPAPMETIVEEPLAEDAPAVQENAAEPVEKAEITQEVKESEPAQTEPAQTEQAPAEPAERPAPSASQVYGMFRGNLSNGYSQAKAVPVTWDMSGTNIKWRNPDMGKQGFSSPVVAGDKIFFTGGDTQTREIYCHSLTDGSLVWTLVADGIPGSPATPPEVASNTGYASATAATDGKYVCAIFATGDIICADVDGNRKWAHNVGVPDNHYGYVSSLVIWNGMVFVQFDNNDVRKVMAFDLVTGDVRWQKERGGKISWSSPIIAMVGGKAQLILMGNPDVTSYDAQTGQQLWQASGMSGEVCPSPCTADGIIYAGNEYAKLIAIDGADGTILWESMDYLPEVSSPVAFGGRLFVATSYGVLAVYDAKTGALLAEKELNVELYSSPMIVDGKLYIIGTMGQMFVYALDEEISLLASFETGELTYATPAYLDGKIVVRTEQSIYCVAE